MSNLYEVKEGLTFTINKTKQYSGGSVVMVNEEDIRGQEHKLKKIKSTDEIKKKNRAVESAINRGI